MHQPVQDERRFDGLAEADFVGEQPAHRIAGGRALRDVELVRKEPDAPPRNEPRPSASRRSRRRRMSSRVRKSSTSSRSPSARRSSERAFELQRPQLVGRRGAPVRQPQRPVWEARSATAVSSRVAMIRTGRPALRSTGISASVSAASRSVVPERGNSTRMRATVERRHASDPELGIETVRQIVAGLPGVSSDRVSGQLHHARGTRSCEKRDAVAPMGDESRHSISSSTPLSREHHNPSRTR